MEDGVAGETVLPGGDFARTHTQAVASLRDCAFDYSDGERGKAVAENNREHPADSILDFFFGPCLGLCDSESFSVGFVLASRYATAVAVLCASRYAAHG